MTAGLGEDGARCTRRRSRAMTSRMLAVVSVLLCAHGLLDASPARAICCGATCCFIDAACRTTGQTGPAGACQVCTPAQSSTQWTITNGTCAIAGTCRSADEVNPANPCQSCKPATSQTAWSPNSGASCDDGDACTDNDACSGTTCAGTAEDCSGMDGVCVE